VYSSDFFGVAANNVEQSYKSSSGASLPVVAIFNGAEGDISANWRSQNLVNAIRLGNEFATNILSAANGAAKDVHGLVKFHYDDVKIPSRIVPNIHNDSCVRVWAGNWKTSCAAQPGIATLGGSKDARTFLYNLGFRDGIVGKNPDPAQGVKYPGVDAFLEKVLHIEFDPLKDFVSLFIRPKAPEKVGLGVYSIGDVILATLPGEFTTTLGKRIAKTVSDSSGIVGATPLLVGLANEYLSYFTTPCEYDLQRYEGSSMLYGQAAGALIEYELGCIAAKRDNNAQYEKKVTYSVGDCRRFGVKTLIENDRWQMEEALSNVLLNRTTQLPERRFPQFPWSDQTSMDARASTFATPVVSIEESSGTGWRVFNHRDSSSCLTAIEEADTSSPHFVSVVLHASRDSLNWRSIWLTDFKLNDNARFRFCVRTTTGTTIHSESFARRNLLDEKNHRLLTTRFEK
jgi:hypothetical protein